MTEINILDCPPGAGKTSAIINYINASPPGERFVFVTPYLSEVKRIRTSCASKRFIEPKNYGSKMNHFISLIERGANIVTTHALFSALDLNTADIIKSKGYTLIIDEAICPVSMIDISAFDVSAVINKYTEKKEHNRLEWTASKYEGRFNDVVKLCDLNRVYAYNDTVLIEMFPIDIYHAFNKIYLMTYLFYHQIIRCYFDYHSQPYKYLYVEYKDGEYKLTKKRIKYNHVDYKSLVHIYEFDGNHGANGKIVDLNYVGNSNSSLSKAWYKQHRGKSSEMSQLRKNLTTYLRKMFPGAPSNAKMWTTFSDYKYELDGDIPANSFLACNIKASNEYRNRYICAYTINRYINPFVVNFFKDKGVEINQDQYALSDLIQWMFRSAIRDEKEIWIYIPSKRMRTLLKRWISKQGVNNEK